MRKIGFYIFLFSLISFSGNASHIVGGDFSLQKLNGDNYLLKLKVFRDCHHGVPYFNEILYVGMFERNTNRYIDNFRMEMSLDDTLVFVGDNCINIPDGCTHIGYYHRVITLPPSVYSSPHGYYFSWERCCRNTIIRNIEVGPNLGNVGMTFYMEIPPLSIHNSTPVFNRDPLTLLCINNPFTFNYNVTDADGDSLVYSLTHPLKGTLNENNPNDPRQVNYPVINSGPYPNTVWRPGFHLGYIIDGNPTLSINRHTGELNITPTRVGVYVVSILVEEYRDGRKLGEVRRELQFTVSTCNTNTPPQLSDNVSGKFYEVYATDHINFPINATDPNPGDSVYLTFKGSVFEGPDSKIEAPYARMQAVSGIQSVNTTFEWTTACQHGNINDTQYVEIKVVDNGCPLPRTTIQQFRIVVKPPPLVNAPRMLCFERENNSTVKINWGRFEINPYFSHYELIRKNPDGIEKVLHRIENQQETSYLDETAFDHLNQNYIYHMVGYNVCGEKGNQTYFMHTVIVGDSFPDATYISSATVVENQHIKLEYKKALEPDFYAYLIYRKKNIDGAQFEFYRMIEDPDQTVFIDTDVDVQEFSYCYKIVVANQCGLESDESNFACSILLEGESSPFEHALNWNNYEVWENDVAKYELYRKDPSTGYELLAVFNRNGLNYIDDKLNYDEGAYWYRIKAYEVGDESKTATSTSNDLFLYQAPLLYIPTSFSPNNDNINDVWGLVPVFVKDINVVVYNRWGEQVYETTDRKKQWAGEYKNAEPSENVFIYTISYSGWDGSIHYEHGNVTIIR